MGTGPGFFSSKFGEHSYGVQYCTSRSASRTGTVSVGSTPRSHIRTRAAATTLGMLGLPPFAYLLLVLFSATGTTSSSSSNAKNSGVATAAKYVANWTDLPTGIESGRLSNAPLLGNGDLGVSVGGSLPGKSPPQPPPGGGQFSIGATPCNASDPRQLWSGPALASSGDVSGITNLGAPLGQCLSTSDLRPMMMRTCGDGDTMWLYNTSTAPLQLRADKTSTHAGYCLNADSRSSPTKPNQPGWIELAKACGQ